MGEPRFRVLEGMLPAEVQILGIDEHTACIIDLERNEARIRGVGGVTLRRAGSELLLKKNDVAPLEVFMGKTTRRFCSARDIRRHPTSAAPPDSFWNDIHSLEAVFHDARDARDPERMAGAILELDRIIWKSSHDLESAESIPAAREIMREWIALMGTALSSTSRTTPDGLGPLVEEILKLRDELRRQKRWVEADVLRDCLQRANVMVDDTGNGARWRVGGQE